VLIRNEAPGFADAIVDVLDDRASAGQRAEAAFERARPYAASAVGRKLEEWWERTRSRAGHVDGRGTIAPEAVDG
jgi:hypothetical protein